MKKGLCSVVLAFVLLSSPVLAQVIFIRGDANSDDKVDLSDSIYLNNYLFKGGAPPECMDAADANDDGKLDLSDGIYLNNYLFLGSGKAPLPPYPEPGIDPTQDDLDCGIENPVLLAAPLESRFGYTNYTIDSFTDLYNTFYGVEAVGGDRTSFSVFYRRCRQECSGPFNCWWVCDLYTCITYVNEGGFPPKLRKENCKSTEYWRKNPLEIDIDQDSDLDRVEVRVHDGLEVDVFDKRGIFNVTLSLYGDLCANKIKDGNEEKVDCGGRCGKCGRKPVLVVPGLMGSYPLRGRLQLDPWLETYTPLLGALRQAGYIENETLFEFPYAWWLSNRENAQIFKERIQEIKNMTGFGKVDVVAHSMGGLLARYYIANESYADDIDQLIMLGTPHQGAPFSHLVWERSLRDQGRVEALSSSENFLFNFYLQRLSKKLGFNSSYAFVNSSGLPSIREAFPIFSYLKNASDMSLVLYPNISGRNSFLEGLNRNISFDKLARLNVSLVVGDLPKSTPEFIAIPGFSVEWGRGDDTVPLKSLIPFNHVSLQSHHRQLPLNSREIVIEKLGTPAALEPFEDIQKWMFVSVFSPVELFLISPSGKRIGFNGSAELNEIPLGFYSREDEFLVIPHPEEGIYRIEVLGTEKGNYSVQIGFIDEDKDSVVEDRREDATHIGEVDKYSIDFNSSKNEIIITPIQQPKPDLVITNLAVQYPTTTLPRAGQNITMTFTLRNNGTVNASGVFWKLDTGSVDADPVNVRGLNISINRSVTVFTRIRYASLGTYTARVMADYQNSIEELNEGNNERSRVITVVS